VLLTLGGAFGCTLSLDLRKRFGELVELQCFQFITPPIEFRLMRHSLALQDWQAVNTNIYDLQHPPSVTTWSRDGHYFNNDLHHRNDVMTCGVLSKGLFMETRGLALNFLLTVWLRESTARVQAMSPSPVLIQTT
jgi:hypothetical protein